MKDNAYVPGKLKFGFQLLLFFFMAISIYFALKVMYFGLELEENHWVRFDDEYHISIILAVVFNLYNLMTGLLLDRGKKEKEGEVLGLKYDEKTRQFGVGIINFSLVLYFFVLAAAVMPAFFIKQ